MDSVKLKLKQWFENEYDDVSQEEKDFRIQYTVFEREESNEWYMNCICECGDEGIYDVEEIQYSDYTNILFESYKNGFSLTIQEYDSMEGCSDNSSIYAIDLYPDYKPKDFIGKVWVRGGAIGWNYITFETDKVEE
jgi:hypothetical protein